jgi:hypothetical protein
MCLLASVLLSSFVLLSAMLLLLLIVSVLISVPLLELNLILRRHLAKVEGMEIRKGSRTSLYFVHWCVSFPGWSGGRERSWAALDFKHGCAGGSGRARRRYARSEGYVTGASVLVDTHVVACIVGDVSRMSRADGDEWVSMHSVGQIDTRRTCCALFSLSANVLRGLVLNEIPVVDSVVHHSVLCHATPLGSMLLTIVTKSSLSTVRSGSSMSGGYSRGHWDAQTANRLAGIVVDLTLSVHTDWIEAQLPSDTSW